MGGLGAYLLLLLITVSYTVAYQGGYRPNGVSRRHLLRQERGAWSGNLGRGAARVGASSLRSPGQHTRLWMSDASDPDAFDAEEEDT